MSGTPFTRLSRTLAKAQDDTVWFECPGCEIHHRIAHGPGDGPRWTWNGHVDLPTFSPSVLVTWKEGDVAKVCHSFVIVGKIQFLPDCTHALAGQTVDLPDWDTV